MPDVRRLTEKGIEAFRAFLDTIRAGEEFQSSPAILYVDGYSAPLPVRMRIEPRVFRSKFDAASDLHEVLRPIDNPTIAGDAGLWSWLALFYFDQLSPVGRDGRRRPRADYHYIPSGEGWGRERHLLAGPYRLFGLYGERARLLLYPPLHQHGNFIYALGSRRELLTNRGLIEAIDLLYWDATRARPKRGATTETQPGNLRRLIAVAQQLDFNYDLYGMTAEEILALLPPEFDAWKERAPRPFDGAPRPEAPRDLA